MKNVGTIVLVHGFLGGIEDWDLFSPPLTKEGYEIHKIALPLHGNESTLKKYDLKSFAQFISIYCEVKNLKDTIFWGYSMGGRILLELFSQKKELFKGLILESVNPGLKDTVKKEARVKIDAEWAQLLLKNYPQFLEKWYSQDLFLDFKKSSIFQDTLQNRLKNSHPDLSRVLTEASPGSNPDYFDLIEGLDVPTLCLVGEKDLKYRELWQKRFEKNKNLDIRTIPNSGHVVHLESPELTLKEVTEFCRRTYELK